MSGKELFEGVGGIDERFIEEAERETISVPHVSFWVKMAPMAACLCLIAGLYFLNPHWNPGIPAAPSEAAQAEDSETKGRPGHPPVTEPQKGGLPDESSVAGEVPSVVLRVERMTAEGFVATVVELVDTNILEIGMDLNVVIADDTVNEVLADSVSVCEKQDMDYAGEVVTVQFIAYDEETGTILVDQIRMGKDD